MAEQRRSLIVGLQETPKVPTAPVDPEIEQAFVRNMTAGTTQAPTAPRSEPTPHGRRTPLTTRVREDLASALKRASLERQLNGVEPSAVQDILDEALEPWLRTHGYLS